MTEVAWQKLNDPKILAEAEKRFERHILLYNDIKEALKFANWLEPIVEDNPSFVTEAPEMVEKYLNFVLKCKFIALPLLPPEDIEDLFEQHITVIFQLPEYYDLWQLLRVKLVAITLYEERDEFKKKLREALLRNQEFLTPDIIIKEDDKEKPPTVENWLRSYIAVVGIEPAEIIKRSEYLTKNKNVAKLLPLDRAKLEQLIALFENLKLSSLTMIGLEERVQTDVSGRPMVFKDGRLEEAVGAQAREVIKKMREVGLFPPVEEEEKKKITEEYLAKEDETINKEEQSLKQEWGHDVKKAQEFLFSYCLTIGPTSVKPERAKGVAVLSFLAENNALTSLLNDDARFKKDFTEFLKNEGLSNELESLSMSAKAPAVFSRFLRYLLEEKLNIDASESPRYGVRLGNLMKKAGRPEYWDLAYYDMKSKTFKWRN